MRYLRMLTNAVAGGVLMAIYLAVLVLQLNPQATLLSKTSLQWAGALLAFYGPNSAVALYLFIIGRDLLASQPLRPAWLSVRLLGWLGAIEAAVAAVLTWVNLRAFDVVMSPAAVGRMRAGAWVTTMAAAVLLGIALFRYSFGRRGGRAAGIGLAATVVISVVAPVWIRGAGERPVPEPRRWSQPARILSPLHVRILALDGASLGFIRQRVAAGQLPNFGRLLDRGATVDLATVRPTQAEAVWSAAATGKFAQKNGVRSSRTYRVNAGDREAVDILPNDCFAYSLVEQGFVAASDRFATSLRARTVWDVLTDYGIPAGIAGWPLTYPARAERGYMLSDRFDEAASSPLRLADSSAGDPTTAVDVGRETFDAWQAKSWQEILPGASASDAEPTGLDRARWDRAYAAAASELALEFAPRLQAVRYEGLGAFGHVYLRDAQPELFGDPRRSGLQRSVLDRYYAYLDDEIGGAIRRLDPGDLLLIVSGFGMEAISLPRRLLARVIGDPGLNGTHELAPDGFLMAYGTNVASGQSSRRGSVVDLAPTVLYYMGVPVGRDMDGIARTDLFVPTFASEHPVRYVASHEK